MTDKRTQETAEHSNMEKDPTDWVTGDEPMTGAQRSYLKTLSEEAKHPFDETLTKAQASRRIEELQAITGRGREARRESSRAQANSVPDRRPDESPADSASEAGEEDPGAALDMTMAEPRQSTSASPSRAARPADKSLDSPKPRSPGLEKEEPELANEEDIPSDDEPGDQHQRGAGQVRPR